jgi:predicted DNA-binding protein (MmcQ/YjbR family)
VKIADHGLYDIVVNNKTIFPGYHMAKHKWVSILLNDTINIKEIYKLIDESYIAIKNKKSVS